MFQRNFFCCFWFTLVLHEVYMRFSTSICMKSRSTFPGKYFSFPFHVQNNMKCQQSSETRLQTVLQISDPCLKDEWPFKVRKASLRKCFNSMYFEASLHIMMCCSLSCCEASETRFKQSLQMNKAMIEGKMAVQSPKECVSKMFPLNVFRSFATYHEVL